ncbi:hypothetical protein WICMUC_001501 [Wickerhamomyces mucosus]|uniref:Phospholipid/glycerol acyltransferase domain-containing protein n=1 Tax=Wickerhamomyces mucosus TaxID=1378264 RepID=A0A9P8TH09_9ASCO|nr:hypothetical protein WICMUC_001501 [Wickerhamomyces mucosus]
MGEAKKEEEAKISPSAHIPKVVEEASSPFFDILKGFFFDFVIFFSNIVIYIFFREVTVRGAYNLPRSGPAIVVVAPHANQFVDGAIIMSRLRRITNRNSPPIIAESSYKQKFIGTLAKLASAIPVPRAQDNLKYVDGEIYTKEGQEDLRYIYGKRTKFTEFTPKGLLGLPESAGNSDIAEIVSDTELVLRKPFKSPKALQLLKSGSRFKYAAKISNDETFQHVFNALHKGGLISIFPEGGSHDRPDLLPIKAGFAIMALGAVAADPSCNLQIIPTGLHYFHRNKFRSRSVVEFGPPIKITAAHGELYKQNPREAVGKLLDEITVALKSVVLTAPDYETLMVIQAARRLYAKKVPLSLAVDMNRKLVTGYTHYKDDPKIVHLKGAVMDYTKSLTQLGLKDHQVELAVRNRWESLLVLIPKFFQLIFYATLSLPGSVLFAPIFWVTNYYSKEKQKAALAGSVVKIRAIDVVATWKIIIATLFAPTFYILYSIIGTFLTKKYNISNAGSLNSIVLFISIYLALVLTTYAAFRTGETGMDIFKSLPPLINSVFGNRKELYQLKKTREKLSLEITEVINSLGPQVFPDFDKFDTKRKEIAKKDAKILKELEVESISEFVSSENNNGNRGRNEYPESNEGRSRSLSAASSISNALSRVNSEGNISDIPILGDGGYSYKNSSDYLSDNLNYEKFPEFENSSGIDEFNAASLKLRKAMSEKLDE